MKLLTLEDYEKVWRKILPKYNYVAHELGENAKTEDILKVMEYTNVSVVLHSNSNLKINFLVLLDLTKRIKKNHLNVENLEYLEILFR